MTKHRSTATNETRSLLFSEALVTAELPLMDVAESLVGLLSISVERDHCEPVDWVLAGSVRLSAWRTPGSNWCSSSRNCSRSIFKSVIVWYRFVLSFDKALETIRSRCLGMSAECWVNGGGSWSMMETRM